MTIENKKSWAEIMTDRGFVSVPEAASIARVHRATVYRWIEADELAANTAGPSVYVKFASIVTKLGPELCKAYGIQHVRT